MLLRAFKRKDYLFNDMLDCIYYAPKKAMPGIKNIKPGAIGGLVSYRQRIKYIYSQEEFILSEFILLLFFHWV